MEIINLDRSEISSLYIEIEKNLSTLKRRGVAYVVNVHSKNLATFWIYVTGRRGTVTKDVVVQYDEIELKWKAYAMNKEYILDSLTDIAIIGKSIINRLSPTLSKI